MGYPKVDWEERARTIIDKLRSDRDRPVKLHMRDLGFGARPSAVIKTLRDKLPWFDEAYEEERQERGISRKNGGQRVRFEDMEGNEGKLDRFLQLFADEMTIVGACNRVNEEMPAGTPLRPGLISQRINTSSGLFDPVFYERFLNAEGNVTAHVYDGLTLNARTPNQRYPHGDVTAQRAYLTARSPLFEDHRHVTIDKTERRMSLTLNVHAEIAERGARMFPGGKVVEVNLDGGQDAREEEGEAEAKAIEGDLR